MSEMVERVAKAIALSDGGTMVGNSQSKATREFGWDGSNTNANYKYVDAHWKEFVNAAYFAIEAMREPTQAMKDAWSDDFNDWLSEKIEEEWYLWYLMIDEALK